MPTDITCYFGFPGCGKTTLIAHDCKKLQSKGYQVYTSGVSIIGVPEFDLDLIDQDIYPAYGSILFIDESGIELNNQTTLSAKKRQFFKLHRHAEITIIYFSQNFEDTNIVLRRLTVNYFYVKKLFGFSLCIPIVSKLVTKPYDPSAGLFDPNRGYGDLMIGFKVGNIFTKGFRLIYRRSSYAFFDTHTLPPDVQLDEYKEAF